ncbi:uncharacterized protein N7525_008145, partial [Penicillium rubens]|uniref:uncharacterized protein n=1 Tax=Penicillium rubens TaxID=1108849 RepID=UPI002A5AF99A
RKESAVSFCINLVLHCDIQPTNLLLDDEPHIKLTVLLGLNGEPTRSYCPRAGLFDTDIKIGLFTLGCTIYLIMMGHAVFPEIVDGEEGYAITSKYCLKEYESVEELLRDIKVVEKGLRTGEATQLDWWLVF